MLIFSVSSVSPWFYKKLFEVLFCLFIEKIGQPQRNLREIGDDKQRNNHDDIEGEHRFNHILNPNFPDGAADKKG